MAATINAVTIASSAAVSGALDADGRRVAAIIGPTAWTAADISFEVYDAANSAWRKVVDSAGGLVKITGVATTASEYMFLPEIADRLIANRLRVVSTNTASEADINQDAARTLYVVLEASKWN